MSKLRNKTLAIGQALVFATLIMTSSCGNNANVVNHFFQANEIVSYDKVDTSKLVINIANLINANTTPLEEALEAKYPNITVISSVGGGENYVKKQAANDDIADIVFYAACPELSDIFYDLSSEEFTSRYNQASLSVLQDDEGKIHQLPIASSCFGIFYNKDLFTEKGWSVPATRTEFYDLCAEIEAEGIRAYAPCLKYDGTIAEVGMSVNNRELFGTVDKTKNFYDYTEGKRSAVGVMEPFLEGLKTLKEKGIIKEADFTSSATQIRQSMYAGTTAMVPYAMNLTTFYDDEKAKAEAEGKSLPEIGFMGYPTDVAGERYLSFDHDATCMALSKKAMKDKTKSKLLLEIFDYLSTNAGQEVLFKCFTGVSSLKTYQTTVTARFQEVTDCMNAGRMYFPARFWDIEDKPTISSWYKGEITDAQMLAKMDEMVARVIAGSPEPEPFATVTESFTRLETSMFMADCFKTTTEADIGLMLDDTLFLGNLMKIYKGPLNDSGIFYLRGASSNEYLTVYDITGANLKLLLEHPYVQTISSLELNRMYAFSGLKITYAPWKDMNSNILSVTMADGTPIDDTKVYKVAAWEKAIDDRYLTKDGEGNIVKTATEYNNCESYLKEVVTKLGTLSPTPYRDGRLTLDWAE